MIQLYGIPNCDTVKKARNWLVAQELEHLFHDYKKAGADPALLEQWAGACGWEVLLNRRGTTFRALAETDKEGIDRSKAVALMVAQPSLIKRPVVQHDGGVLVGFAVSEWERALC